MILLILCTCLCAVCTVMSSHAPLWCLPALLFLALLLIQSLYLHRKSRTDPLTGLYNLRHLQAMEGRYRHHPTITVYYFDLDDLKRVNDTGGHEAGDKLLVDFAADLRRKMPRGGRAFRVGGDEFLLILPGSAAYNPESDFSASWGSASGSGKDLRNLIRGAEQQMYREKPDNHR